MKFLFVDAVRVLERVQRPPPGRRPSSQRGRGLLMWGVQCVGYPRPQGSLAAPRDSISRRKCAISRKKSERPRGNLGSRCVGTSGRKTRKKMTRTYQGAGEAIPRSPSENGCSTLEIAVRAARTSRHTALARHTRRAYIVIRALKRASLPPLLGVR